MIRNDSLGRLVALSICIFIACLCAVISVATDGWSTNISASLLAFYATDKENLLWVVGCVVFLILGIVCLCISAVVLLARFFNHGKGRAILGGVLSIFAGVVFLVTLIIFMVQEPPDGPVYGYSFALLWVAIPFAIVAGVVFFSLEDSEFLM